MDCGHRLGRERIHLLLIDDALRGLDDVISGCVREADQALATLQERRG